mgnify:CR=1 FL=1|tara:strand:+ start:3076 stop:3426 length:351 start_codon:yes stop_codon:yes gene_type:complete
MDNTPAKDEPAEAQPSKIDRAEMLSDLQLMHCRALQKEIERLEIEYNGTMLRVERELQVRTQKMEQRLQEAQAEIDRLLRQETVLHREIDRIYNSMSMRATAPLRKISQISRFWRN